MRAGLAVALLITTVACDTKLNGIASSLSVDPQQVTFPETATGDTRTQPLTLSNGSRAPLELHLSAPAPFALELDVKLAGGESRALELPFTPTALGAHTASLSIDGDLSTTVVLTGTAVAPRVCASPSACRTSTRDPSTNTCTTTNAPDGTPCSGDDLCLTGSTCHAGACVGTPVSCDDSNACTVDLCEAAGGCAHFDTTCPEPKDKCHVALCDPRTGCSTVPAADGTSCGPSSCTTADVCMAGECKTLPVPDGYACGTDSPCRAKGRCELGACNQPPATQLATSWSYPIGYPGYFDFRGVTDASGNLYWVECTGLVGLVPCELVSYTAAGTLRFRTSVPAIPSGSYVMPHVASMGRVFVASQSAAVSAFSDVDGAHLWTRPAPGLTKLGVLAADHQGNVRLSQKMEAESEQWSLVSLNALTGIAITRPIYGPMHGLVLDAQDNVYFTVSNTWQPLGPAGTPTPMGTAFEDSPPDIHLISLTPGGARRFVWPRPLDPPVAAYNGELLLASGAVVSTATGLSLPSPAERNQTTVAPAPLMSSTSRFRWDEWGCCPACDCDGPGATRLEGFARGVAQPQFQWGTFNAWQPHVTEMQLLSDGSALFASVDFATSDVKLRALDAAGAEKFACLVGSELVGTEKLRRWYGATALTNGRWAVLEHTACPYCIHDPPPVLRVFAAPGLTPAFSGWTGPRGGPGRAGFPR